MLNKFLLPQSPTASCLWSKGKVDREEAKGPITVLWEVMGSCRQCQARVGLRREMPSGSHCPASIPWLGRVESSLFWRILKQRLCFYLFLLGMLERRVSEVPSLSGI